MTIAIRPLHKLFAAEVTGVDTARPLDADMLAALTAAIDRHAVLVLPEQRLDDERQMAFARHFGELELPRSGRAAVKRRLRPEIADISNLDENQRVRGRDDPRRFDQLGNRLWHTDGSFRRVPAALSMLYAHKVPRPGPAGKGETEFADMRAAYDALDERTKAEVEDLVCEHSLIYSRAAIGFTELTSEERAAFAPVRQPLVRRHPVTGRRSLFLASHAGAIVGWTVPEAQMFLRDLVEHATQREFVYAHRWRVGDLVMWDNRQTMHRARRFDRTEVRDVRRTTLAGEAAIPAKAGIGLAA